MNQQKQSIKNISINGLLYRFAERILAQLVSTIVTIVLARILLPKDYGIVSLVTILINICNVFVSNGLSSSLIQKKNSDQKDFSTIFWVSLFLSFVIYGMIWFGAPLVALFYKNEVIIPVMRLMGLRLPLAAINSVQSAYVSKHYLFRKFFLATLIGTVVSGVVGITMATKGFGVYALVAQYLTNSLFDTVILFILVRWHPSLYFSFDRFKTLFSFGWKVLVSALIDVIYEEIRSLVIGKEYSTEDLSFYTKGQQFPKLIGNNISVTIMNVMFPIFSTKQDDMVKLKSMVRRAISVSNYILCPLLIGLAAIAPQFVSLVLTEKWLPAVPYVRLFSIMYLLKPLRNINKCVLNSIGKSGVDLKINFAEKAFGVLLIILCLKSGTMVIAYGALITYFMTTTVYAISIGKLIRYSLKEQLIDIGVPVLLSIIACIPVVILDLISIPLFPKFLLQIISAVLIYVLLSLAFKVKSFQYVFSTISEYLKKMHHLKSNTDHIS